MTVYRFEEIAHNINDKKMPVPGDEKTYIGLEHLDTGSLQVTRWGQDVVLTGEKLVMKKGDVLFGRRNTYLRRAAIAPHDGIFSAHGMIFRPKTDVIDAEFFPFFISSDYFIDEAIKISVGSLSPTVNWGTLKKLEFDLPSMEEQKRLAKILMAAEETRQAYKKLIAQTDGLVKAKFEEMFGSVNNCVLSEIADIIMGQSPDSKYYNTNKQGIPFYQGKTEFGDKYIGRPVNWCTNPTRLAEKDDVLMSVRAPVGSVNMAVEHCCIGRGLAGIRAKKNVSLPMFLYFALKTKEKEIEDMGVGGTFKAINKDVVVSIKIPCDTIEKQEEFVAFAEQAEQTKLAAQQSLDALNETVRALVNRNFN